MEWRVVPDTDSLLWVSENGEVYREAFVNRRNVKIPEAYPSKCVANNGYYVFRAFNELYLVHRCVGKAFVDGMTEEKRYINHKDGNKLNNNFSNLEWVTGWENIEHALENNLVPQYSQRNYTKGNLHYSSKIPEESIEWILENFDKPKSEQIKQVEIAKMFNVTPSAINNIRKGRCWAWKVTEGF